MMISDHADHVIISVVNIVGTAAVYRFGVYVAKAMPQLPPNAGWWMTFIYNLFKNIIGVDPSAVILSPTQLSSLPQKVSDQLTTLSKEGS